VETELKNPETLSSKVYARVKNMVQTRNHYKCFGRGKIEWLKFTGPDHKPLDEILVYKRSDGNKELLIVQNLSDSTVTAKLPDEIRSKSWKNVLDKSKVINRNAETIMLKPLSYLWLTEVHG
jgi:hypothetical protein